MGYDMSHAVWHNAGWQEMRDLRRKLEDLKELRDLIKKLGRASGKGPKRRAPQEVRCVDLFIAVTSAAGTRACIRPGGEPARRAGLPGQVMCLMLASAGQPQRLHELLPWQQDGAV